LGYSRRYERNASPPDGFNVEFYLATWNWIGDDVHAIIQIFFHTGVLPPQSNKTHIALIPKKTYLSGTSRL
jgi:hypothetical protein